MRGEFNDSTIGPLEILKEKDRINIQMNNDENFSQLKIWRDICNADI